MNAITADKTSKYCNNFDASILITTRESLLKESEKVRTLSI